MRRRLPAESNSEVLSNPVAERLLERASELDAALRGGTPAVSELRSAATEAGISPQAFDAALAELRDTEEASAPNVTAPPPARRRTWALAAAVMALIAVGTLGVARRAPVDAAGAPMIERAFLVRCLSADQAAALIRPVLDLPTNTVVVSPERALACLPSARRRHSSKRCGRCSILMRVRILPAHAACDSSMTTGAHDDSRHRSRTARDADWRGSAGPGVLCRGPRSVRDSAADARGTRRRVVRQWRSSGPSRCGGRLPTRSQGTPGAAGR